MPIYEEIELRICRNCVKAGKKDVVLIRKKRCILCHKLTQLFEPKVADDMDLKRKFPKGVKRFPREVAKTDAQRKVIDVIVEKCRDFDCPGQVVEVRQGPRVTEYEFSPDRFTRLKRLKSINEDLAMALEAETVTVQRLPGKAAIGISLPNAECKEVLFDDCLKNVIAHRYDMALPINFGITSTGEPYVEDLAQIVHLLIGGSTGAGKSVFINNILQSLLYIRSPKELQLILIDPKSVELFPYRGLPHLKEDPVADIYQALGLLEQMVQEMRRRTSNLHAAGVKNIAEYNAKMKKEGHPDDTWPYILVVIDELADLVMQEKKAFIEKMASLAGMARAAGIHVIAATQRPSVDVLSGKVKVNFQGRLAFRVPSPIDSKTILGHKGAEQLLGKGDMFFVSPSKTGLQRLHSPNTKRENLEKLMKLSIELGHHFAVPADGVEGVISAAEAGKPKPAAAPVVDKAAEKKSNGKAVVQ
jgi:DNA segregation ATPase FtsK/SpoIIIE, S-DNA-T family